MSSEDATNLTDKSSQAYVYYSGAWPGWLYFQFSILRFSSILVAAWSRGYTLFFVILGPSADFPPQTYADKIGRRLGVLDIRLQS